MAEDFTLSVAYWPRRTAYRWWAMFDRGELREDMQQLAALGFREVRIALGWEDVQPAPQKVSAAVLDRFEQALEEIGGCGLRAHVTLLPAALGGALAAPRWVAHPDLLPDLLRFGPGHSAAQVARAIPVLYEGAVRSGSPHDMFRDTGMIAAQCYLVREVLGYFGPHPAAARWQIGEGLERLHPPEHAAAVAEWLRTMDEQARSAYAKAALVGAIAPQALLGQAGPRPDQVASAFDMAAITLDEPLPLEGFRLSSRDALTFLHALASALADRPLAALGLGQPTTAVGQPAMVADTLYGRSTTTALATHDQQAELLAAMVARLRGMGAPLVALADASDYPSAHWATPPLDRSLRARALGLIDAAGREKPAAAAVREAALAAPTADPGLPEPIDIERYWHDPAHECARLWRDFQQARR
ncbi:hypothetical protein F8S13_03870 [Chloroflexia bacterium SDU3-3]|nr:hypothetical protein F8S13_03870 [Chloroflexia bacterium SDU3-3]